MSRTSHLVLLSIILVSVSGCGEAEPAIQCTTLSEFQFGRGSGLHGLDLLRITSDGKAIYEYQPSRGSWLRKSFTVDETRMKALVEKINSLNILGMEKRYQDPSIHDGTQWCLLIKADGKTKPICFNNKFPARINKLASFVDATIWSLWRSPLRAWMYR